MREVSVPGGVAEAHLMADLLKQAGIQAHVVGASLQGAMGELPAHSLIRLLVSEEHEHEARALLSDLEQFGAQAHEDEPPLVL